MVGAAGQLIIFFSLMVAQIIFGGLILTYAAYSFLHVLVSTAAGTDEIKWPGDPLFDWLFKGWYLAWIVGLSLLPALLIVSLARIHPSSPIWGISFATSACVFFPIFLLSSLSGASRLWIFRGQILGGMGRRFGLAFVFYIFSAIILLGSTTLLWYSLVYATFLLVPVATISMAVAFMLYARLLGRLGHAITEEPIRKKAAKGERPRTRPAKDESDKWGLPAIPLLEDEKPKPRQAVKKKRTKKSSSNAVDPWAIPELEPLARPSRPTLPADDDPLGPAVGGYEWQSAAKDEAPSSRQSQADMMNDEREAYGMALGEAPPEPARQREPALTEVSNYELALATTRRTPDLPANPMINGIFSFPFYPTTLGPLLTIALGLTVMGLIARLQIALFP